MKKIILCSFALILCSWGIFAQSLKKYEVDNFTEYTPWYHGGECAVNALHRPMEFASISLSSSYKDGKFYRPQEGRQYADVCFEAEGSQNVGKFSLSGSFNFCQSWNKGVMFASTLDPFDWNPYVIYDQTGGDWSRQSYSLWADIAYPIIKGKLSAGLGIDLKVGRGAKKVDPRPQANSNHIELRPSLAYAPLSWLKFGVAFIYALEKENSNLILYDSSVPQKLYLMKGLGQYTYEIFSNTERERKFEGDIFGGAFNVEGALSEIFRARVQLEYLNSVKSSRDIDFSKPHQRGKLFTDQLNCDVSFSGEFNGMMLLISEKVVSKSASGRELVQYFDPSPQVNSWITDSSLPGRYHRSLTSSTSRIAAVVPSKNSGTYVVDLSMIYSLDKQKYEATESFMNISRRVFSGAFEYIHDFPKAWIRGGVELGGAIPSKCENSVCLREEQDRTILEGLITPDFDYLSSKSISCTLKLSCGFSVGKTDLSIGAQGGILSCPSRKKNSARSQLFLGLTF